MSAKSGPVHFCTKNFHKFIEARSVLSKYGIELKMSAVDKRELQHDDVGQVAQWTLTYGIETISEPILVEDAGLYIHSLKGFPGPYSSYAYRTLGVDGVLKLLKDSLERKAEFRSAIAFRSADGRATSFIGVSRGAISEDPKGTFGFGFDPIFTPENSSSTFAQMSLSEKNRYSHRARALREFARWYTLIMPT